MRALRSSIAAVMLAHATAGMALAMNWEGHDEWEHLPAMAEESGLTAPKPVSEPLPLCSDKEARAKRNAYEQIAVPGKNCREDRK